MNVIKIIICLAISILISSCEEVIDIETSPAPLQPVIDAWITTENKIQTIRITNSQAYFNNSEPVPITNAEVKITNQNGNEFFFEDLSANGYYHWNNDGINSIGETGDELELNITIDDNAYSAHHTIKDVPPIDSIVQSFEDDIFLDAGNYLEFYARDLEGLGDTYWIKAFKNGKYLSNADQINIAYDAAFTEGSDFDGLVFIQPIRFLINELDGDGIDLPWEAGETSRVEIHSISNAAFNFLTIATEQILNGDNGIFTLPLANTRSNIISQGQGEDALGFFNVAKVSSLEYTVE